MSDFWQIVLGAFLAIVGGAANNELSEWRSRCRERKAVSISNSMGSDPYANPLLYKRLKDVHWCL